MSKPLTPRQASILAFIRGKKIPPTMREIGTEFGIKSPNGVAFNLKALEKKGFIVRDPMKSRGITVVGQNDELIAVLQHCRACAKFAVEPVLLSRIDSEIKKLMAKEARRDS